MRLIHFFYVLQSNLYWVKSLLIDSSINTQNKVWEWTAENDFTGLDTVKNLLLFIMLFCLTSVENVSFVF